MNVHSTPRPRLAAIFAVIAAIMVGGTVLYAFRKPLWHKLVVNAQGEKSVDERMAEILKGHPDLAELHPATVALLCYKEEKRVDIYIDSRKWRSFAITAASGKAGPKHRSGDGQVPEGIYRIAAVNPNSAYHLSLKVSYPNADDRRRSDALGVTDYGGDIYIHGSAVSIGCIAVGDAAIEQIFYVVNRVGYESVEVVIAPTDLLAAGQPVADADAELYRAIRQEMARISGGAPDQR